MGLKSRNKGKAGEREIAALVADLTGFDVRRRVRQHDGDSDLLGIPGWCMEVKRYARATRSDVRTWWQQACQQAADAHETPVLLYRQDRDEWRAVWPLSVLIAGAAGWTDYQWTIEASPQAWAAVVREALGDAP